MLNLLILQSYEDYKSNLCEFFESIGFSVSSGLDAEQGFLLLKEKLFDVIICDLDYELFYGLDHLLSLLDHIQQFESLTILISARHPNLWDVIPRSFDEARVQLVNGKRLVNIRERIEDYWFK